MAIIIRGATACSLCEAVLAEGEDIIGSPHFIHDQCHRLWRFSDSGMHRVCFMAWSEAPEFRAAYNDLWNKLVPEHPREMLSDGTIVDLAKVS